MRCFSRRLNRAGRDITPYAAIIAAENDFAKKPDPVYGEAIKQAWDCLTKAAKKEKSGQIVEFGAISLCGWRRGLSLS